MIEFDTIEGRYLSTDVNDFIGALPMMTMGEMLSKVDKYIAIAIANRGISFISDNDVWATVQRAEKKVYREQGIDTFVTSITIKETKCYPYTIKALKERCE